jgi:ankyrin repeat protein
LEKGANVNAKSDGGDTPLHWASKYGNDAIVSLLLENGAKVNVKGEYGWTPLHYASSRGQDAVISLLLENGADVDAKKWNGETPLHEACREGGENRRTSSRYGYWRRTNHFFFCKNAMS